MVGQVHVLRAIQNALQQQRLHHAYLFTGTRGVGKTTIARLFAKALNCEQGITSEPCGQCKSCTEIDQGRSIDLIEVDAASRTKVEDTRELLDNVQYAPTHSRYKIYLIDEVHMLSGHSFNALLKTLEEPPEHVKFLLATTDPQKLPITVLSRCLQFHLKNLPNEQISQYLQQVLQAENISFEADALNLIAKAAMGSMRDALSTLDRAIAFCQQKVNVADVSAMLGVLPEDAVFNLVEMIQYNKSEELLKQVDSVMESTLDYAQILDELVNVLHQIAVAQVVKTQDCHPRVKGFAAHFSPEDIQLYYQIALMGRRDLPLLANPRQGLEMTLLRMLTFKIEQANTTTQASASTRDVASRAMQVNQQSKPTMQPSAPSGMPTQSVSQPQQNHVQMPTASTSSNEVISIDESSDWPSIVKGLNLSGITLLLANHCCLHSRENGQFNLQISPVHSAMLNDRAKERLQAAVESVFKKKVKLNFTMVEPESATPAVMQQQQAAAKQEQLVSGMMNDPNVQAMQKVFGIDASSAKIEPITK